MNMGNTIHKTYLSK